MSTDVREQLTNALSTRYAVERLIGTGGMATVYLARDLKHDRQVALKVLNPELGAVLGADRFLAEIKVTANLQHPNLLPLFDSGDADGLLFYVMPYVEGESLRARLDREKQLPVDEALRLAIAVASALDYAHRRGVIHRDLKPENILLHEGQPLVADFGIALAVSKAGGNRVTQTGLSLGTPQYMSPEQATGDRVIDARADIYSLGAVLYEMLVSDPPHLGSTAQAIIAKVLTEKPPHVRIARESVPENVDHAIEKSLAKIPADRFASAQQFADALSDKSYFGDRLGSDTSIQRRSRRTIAFASAAALILVAGAFAAGMLTRHSVPAAVPRFFSIALPDSAPFMPGRDFLDATARALTISSDGRSLVYSALMPDHTTRLMLARLDLGSVEPLRNTGAATLPTFSPDGRAVAFESGNELRRLSLDDGSLASLGTAGWTDGLLWDKDGLIYGSSIDRCFWSVSASGGSITKLGVDTCHGEQLSVIPNSEWMLFGADGVVSVLSRKTHATRSLSLSGTSQANGPVRSGGSPFMASPGVIAFFRDSTIYAARFDEKRLLFLSEPQPLLTGIRSEGFGAHATMSDDGTFVWIRGGDGTLSKFVWTTADGVIRDSLFLPRTLVTSYSLSADGNRLAFSTVSPNGGPLLYVATLDRKVVQEVKTKLPAEPLNWIDHGRKLVVAMFNANAVVRIAVVKWRDGTAAVDTSEAPFDNESPDGSQRCSAANKGDVELWNTSEPTRKTRVHEGDSGWCRFSPDGTRLVWVGDSGGLYIAGTGPDAAQTQVQLATEGRPDEPQWSADGKRIFYRDANRWYVVDAPSSGTTATTPPRLLFQGHFLQALASWALAPDGRFLLLAGQDGAPARRIEVLTHFPDFVEQKLRAAK